MEEEGDQRVRNQSRIPGSSQMVRMSRLIGFVRYLKGTLSWLPNKTTVLRFENSHLLQVCTMLSLIGIMPIVLLHIQTVYF